MTYEVLLDVASLPISLTASPHSLSAHSLCSGHAGHFCPWMFSNLLPLWDLCTCCVLFFWSALLPNGFFSLSFFFFLNQIFRDAFPDCYTWNIFPSVTQSFTALLTLCLSLQRAECWCSSVASLIVYLPCQNVIFTWTGAFSCSWLLLLQLKQPSAHSRNSINACLKKCSMNLILRAHFFKVRSQTISISLY